MIGRLISGRYRIEAVVGTGGMAVVYRALDLQENKTVAIKVLRPEYESDMEFVRRFSREAEAAAKMSHENIVNLLDVGIEGEMRYIVMEYVDGQTLKQMIRDEGRIHPDVALRMTIRILAAVDHAHRNGIVHRDIKPQNILVDRQGRVKVADFGIARLKASQTTQLDPNGSAMGSVHYLSPEQARGEVANEQSDLDFRADVPSDFGMFRLGTLQSDLEEAFHKKVDLVTSGMLDDPLSGKLAQNIEEDEVNLYGIGK